MKNRDSFFLRLCRICFCCMAIWLGSMTMAMGQGVTIADESSFGEEQDIGMVSDPLESLNRVFFHFNDKLYFWVLKPVSQGYAYVVAEDVRMCVRNFLKNLLAPVRIVNNLLQGKVVHSGVEISRFVINSTLGIAGLVDPAKNEFGLSPKDEDLGQTLGMHGLGEGIYICWPFLGPSNVRDSIGLAGDFFLSPISYLAMSDPGVGVAFEAGKEVNDTSLALGDYEDFKESAIDPYVSLRDAYRQYRQKKIRDVDVGGNSVYISLLDKLEKTYAMDMPGQVSTDLASGVLAGNFIEGENSVEAEQVLPQQGLLVMNKDSFDKIDGREIPSIYVLQVPVEDKFDFAR